MILETEEVYAQYERGVAWVF